MVEAGSTRRVSSSPQRRPYSQELPTSGALRSWGRRFQGRAGCPCANRVVPLPAEAAPASALGDGLVGFHKETQTRLKTGRFCICSQPAPTEPHIPVVPTG